MALGRPGVDAIKQKGDGELGRRFPPPFSASTTSYSSRPTARRDPTLTRIDVPAWEEGDEILGGWEGEKEGAS